MDGPDTWLLFQSQIYCIDLSDVKTWCKLLLRTSSNSPFKMAFTVTPTVMANFKCKLDTAYSHVREGRMLVEELWVYLWGLSWSIIGPTPCGQHYFLGRWFWTTLKKSNLALTCLWASKQCPLWLLPHLFVWEVSSFVEGNAAWNSKFLPWAPALTSLWLELWAKITLPSPIIFGESVSLQQQKGKQNTYLLYCFIHPVRRNV